MGLSFRTTKLLAGWRQPALFDVAVLIVNLALFALFVSGIYLFAARACPNPDEGRILLTWYHGRMTPTGWPTWSVILPYFFYHYLGVTSVEGLQKIGMVISVLGAAGVNFLIFTRFGLERYTRALILFTFNVALASGSEQLYMFHFFARWSVLAYPLRIFAGFVFIYLLASYSQDKRSFRNVRTITLGALMAFLVYAHYILVLPTCAVFGALCIVRIVRRQIDLKRIRHWILPVLMLFVLPVATGILVVILDPHPQMTAPRWNLRESYFTYSDVIERGIPDYVVFLARMSKNLAYQAAYPFAWVPGYWPFASMASYGPFFLISIGLIVSFFRRNELRFLVATFLLVDLLLRLGANLGGWFPYGTIRYALSQAFALQVMAAFGLRDVLAIAYWPIARWTPATIENRLRTALACAVIFGLAGTSLFCGIKALGEQRSASLQYRQDAEVIKGEFGSLRGATIILTDDQERLIVGNLLGEEFFEMNNVLYLPSGISSGKPFDPERAEVIRAGLLDRDEIHTITFRPYLDEIYGATAYRLVASDYSLVSERRMWDLYFATWKHTNPETARSP